MIVTCPKCEYHFDLDDERLEGMAEIRKFIDPRRSQAWFYRYVRPQIEHLLIVRASKAHHLIGIPKYFTFKRLLIAWMIERKYV